MTSGILLLAHQQPVYVRMAWNLAALLRHRGYTGNIALLTDTNVSEIRGRASMFTHIVALNQVDNIAFYAKTKLGKYTPFDRTLFLDVDAFPLRDVTPLVEQDFGLMLQNFGPGIRDNAAHWSTPTKLYELYGISHDQPFIETNSSFIAWSKSDKTDAFFTLAEHLYASEWVEDYSHNIGHYPDELAFNTALMLMGYRLDRFQPILFHSRASGPISWDKAAEQYYLAGMYGNETTTHSHVWREYWRRCDEDIKALTGDYGFRVRPSDKASNGGYKRPRWKGLRKRERPQHIQDIFNNYQYAIQK